MFARRDSAQENESDRREGTWMGRYRVPFPFSAVVSIVGIVVLLVAGVVSIPWTFVANRLRQRREARFAAEMKAANRFLCWAEAHSRASGGGTFVEEYQSAMGPYRLWWTPDEVATLSTHPCCFDFLPWEYDHGPEFFDWCRERYTDPGLGSALLIERPEKERGNIGGMLATLRKERRCVSIYSGW